MKEDDIHITDLGRILQGEVPAEFFIELFIRLVICYVVALVAMRLIGKRMAAQMSRNELAALVSIAAALGIFIQAPDRGLLPAIVVVMVIVLVSRFTARIAYKSNRFEEKTQGRENILVKDAVLQLKTMERERISKERVFALLRSLQVKNLGEVKRLYMEANGQFSLMKEKQKKPGLSILPEWDHAFIREQDPDKETSVCANCGYLRDQNITYTACPHCKKQEWTKALN
jgi:uncharacterized membrane protein YcaP (DUF421 family)